MPEDRPRRTVDGYIEALDPAQAAIASRLREIVREAVPDARESVKWGQPVYETTGPFVALKAFPRWVTLTFWRGAALADASDPDAILGGDGDRMRHVQVRSVEEIRETALGNLVRAAADLNRALGDPTKRG